VWDPRKALACGFLYKKAGKGKIWTSGRFALRFFVINTVVGSYDNYMLDHYEEPEDLKPKAQFPLAGATLRSESEIRFELVTASGVRVDMKGETEDSAVRWIVSLTRAIAVANEREEMLSGVREEVKARDDARAQSGGGAQSGGAGFYNDDELYDIAAAASSGDVLPVQPLSEVGPSVFAAKQMDRGPMLRLDIDIHDMPPSSTQRHQFEEMFKKDIVRALAIDPEEFVVEVLSIGPAGGKNWLTMVEFDLYVVVYNDEDDANNEDANELREDQRARYLMSLLEMLGTPNSAIYRGFITCKLDATFAKNFPSQNLYELDLFSADAKIEAILNKYKNITVPNDSLDFSYFSIVLEFEGTYKQVSIPNPRIFGSKLCVLWPYEVKAALGFMGTMQDLWVEPTALVPRGLPSDMTYPITFESCATLGVDEDGDEHVAISAHRLKAGLTYEVKVDDYREDVINTLTKKEKQRIKAVFDEFDLDGSGDLSRAEAEELVRQRVASRKDDIDTNFAQYLQNAKSEEEAKHADELRLMYHQSLQESQNRLVKLYEAADMNGDGVISFTEFLLAEAWWLRCTLDPNKHLDFS
jgi:Ca2+-binding EF-hand superfamily protein